MSDKIREFVEIPQQFAKEGTQVSRSSAPGFAPARNELDNRGTELIIGSS